MKHELVKESKHESAKDKHETAKDKHDSKSKGTPKLIHFENLSEVPVSDILL